MTREDFLHHENLIKQWAQGSKIEFYDEGLNRWMPIKSPNWHKYVSYRVQVFNPNQGERILVSNDGCNWEERTFFYRNIDDVYICILENTDTKEWMSFIEKGEFCIYTNKWKYAKPLIKE